MAGIFTLGFIGGAANAFSEAKRAEAEAQAKEKDFERQKALNVQQYELGIQASQAEALLQSSLQKDLAKFQSGLRREEGEIQFSQQLSADLSIRAYEDQLAKAKTQEERTYLEKRIKELNEQVKTAVEAGNPFVAPAGWTTYGYKEALEAGTNLSTAKPMAGVDPKTPLMHFTDRNGRTRYIPGVNVKYLKSDADRVNQKIFNVADGVSTELWWHIENGDPHGLLKDIRSQLVANLDKKTLRSNLMLNKDESGKQYIQNPIEAFPVLEKFTKNGQVDRATQEWWIDNIIGPQLGVATEGIKEAIGYPRQLPLTYDEFNDRFIGAAESTYDWATEYVGMGSPNYNPDAVNPKQIKPEIWNKITKVRDASNTTALRVMSLVSESTEPEKMLDLLVKEQQIMKPLLTRQESGAISVNYKAKDRLYKLVKNLPPEQGIEVMRLFTKDDSPRTITSVEISQGQTKAVYNKKFTDLYGINREDARARAYAAGKAKTVILQMKDLAKSGQVGAGKVAQVKKTLAGLGELARDFAELTSQISGEKNQDALTGIQKKLADVERNPEIADSARLQYVFDLLGETLAYYQAAALQGGAQGRDISNQDVQFQREKLGLTGFSVYTPGIMANLDYLEDQMNSTYTVYNAYANTTDDAEFEAVFLYDQAMGGMAPTNYAEARSGAPKEFTGKGTVGGGLLGSQQYVERVINGETKRFPIIQFGEQ